jgi:hypothetical protein
MLECARHARILQVGLILGFISWGAIQVATSQAAGWRMAGEGAEYWAIVLCLGLPSGAAQAKKLFPGNVVRVTTFTLRRKALGCASRANTLPAMGQVEGAEGGRRLGRALLSSRVSRRFDMVAPSHTRPLSSNHRDHKDHEIAARVFILVRAAETGGRAPGGQALRSAPRACGPFQKRQRAAAVHIPPRRRVLHNTPQPAGRGWGLAAIYRTRAVAGLLPWGGTVARLCRRRAVLVGGRHGWAAPHPRYGSSGGRRGRMARGFWRGEIEGAREGGVGGKSLRLIWL